MAPWHLRECWRPNASAYNNRSSFGNEAIAGQNADALKAQSISILTLTQVDGNYGKKQ
jgi:hypothetical protein